MLYEVGLGTQGKVGLPRHFEGAARLVEGRGCACCTSAALVHRIEPALPDPLVEATGDRDRANRIERNKRTSAAAVRNGDGQGPGWRIEAQGRKASRTHLLLAAGTGRWRSESELRQNIKAGRDVPRMLIAVTPLGVRTIRVLIWPCSSGPRAISSLRRRLHKVLLPTGPVMV